MESLGQYDWLLVFGDGVAPIDEELSIDAGVVFLEEPLVEVSSFFMSFPIPSLVALVGSCVMLGVFVVLKAAPLKEGC